LGCFEAADPYAKTIHFLYPIDCYSQAVGLAFLT